MMGKLLVEFDNMKDNGINLLPALLLQHIRDTIRDIRDGRKRTKVYIHMGRLISYILMESQLIDSLTDTQFSKGMQPLDGNILNAK